MDLGEALNNMNDDLDYSGRHEVISRDPYESKYDVNHFTEFPGPVVFMHPNDGNQFCLNAELVEAIHAKDLQPILYVTSEALDFLSGMHLKGQAVVGHWDVPFRERLVVVIKWVEDNRSSEDGRGGIEIQISGDRNYVWMIDHDPSQDNYNQLLNMWKAEWRD